MGTPDFAVPSLKILVENGFDVVGVITATDKLGGRGKKKLLQSAVKQFALNCGLNILQPPNLKNPEFVERLRSLNADLQIVVAFRMLPEVVWNMPPLGTYNLHASLLPSYRGAAPINWAIIRGDEFTGLTTFKLRHEIDTGHLAFQHKIAISKTDTAGSLHDKMMHEGAHLVLKTVRAVSNGTIQLVAQDNPLASKAPKIFHADCRIDFNQSASIIYDYIRGLSPYPTAWTILDQKKFKIFRAEYSYEVHNKTPGNYDLINGKELRFTCKDGFIYCKEVQLEGKKRMTIRDFLNGYTLK